MINKGIILSDLHFGIKDSSRLYNELHIITDFLNDHDDIKFVIFNGDYFHSKLALTEPAANYAIDFFIQIFEIMKERNGVIRMIQGTRSHDLNQPYNAFQKYQNLGVDFKIIEKVQTEEILGMKLLYIPEEYPQNAEEYYREFKNQEYNIIFGHGTWDFVAQQSQIELGNRTDILSAPVFIWKDWKNCVKNGFIAFGHIHGRNTFGKKIFYSGSFTRWNFGERSEKGFSYFEYDTEKEIYNVEYINNLEAPKYDVMALSEVQKFDELSASDLQKIIDERLQTTDNLRVDIGGISDEKIKILKEHYQQNQSIKLEVRTQRKSALKESVDKELEEEFSKYHYITKKQLPLDETIQRFCREEIGVELTLEEIRNILKDGKEE